MPFHRFYNPIKIFPETRFLHNVGMVMVGAWIQILVGKEDHFVGHGRGTVDRVVNFKPVGLGSSPVTIINCYLKHKSKYYVDTKATLLRQVLSF